MRVVRWILAVVAAFVVCGCEPGKTQVIQDVLRDNPHSRILGISVGEGDSDHCYYYATFYDSLAGGRYLQVYGYMRVKGLRWQVFHKDAKKLLP